MARWERTATPATPADKRVVKSTRATRWSALALIAIAPGCAFAADAPSAPCGPDTRWADFSEMKLEADADTGPRGVPFKIRIEHTVRDDGMRVVGIDDGRRTEVIALRRAGTNTMFASTPTALREFGEVGMIYAVPMAALAGSFRSVCELADKASHPVALHQGGETLAGTVRLEGEAVHFDLTETGTRGRFTYVGSVDYHRPRGTLPGSLPIAGWTVFTGHSSAPEDGVKSTFDTLGAYEASVATPTPAPATP